MDDNCVTFFRFPEKGSDWVVEHDDSNKFTGNVIYSGTSVNYVIIMVDPYTECHLRFPPFSSITPLPNTLSAEGKCVFTGF